MKLSTRKFSSFMCLLVSPPGSADGYCGCWYH
jgi:hypothetical protein